MTNKKIGLIFLAYFLCVAVVHGATTYYSQIEQVEWNEPTFSITMIVSDKNPYVNDTISFSGNVSKNGDLMAGKTVSLYESIDNQNWNVITSNTTDVNGFYIIEYSRSQSGTCFYKTGVSLP